MTKDEFLRELNNRLQGYPDKDDVISFYYEQISDRLEAGETEEEIFRDIRIEDVVAEIREKAVDAEFVGESHYEEKQQNTWNQSTKASNPTSSKPMGNGDLSGGKKFWYIVFCIASVCFCIAAVGILISAIGIIIQAVCVFVAAAVAFTESVGVGVILIGVGLLLSGIAVVAIYYSKVLVRYMFSHRRSWTESVRKSLGGR